MESGDTPAREPHTHEAPVGIDQRSRSDAAEVRAGDIEPYLTLQYLARMLKLLAVLVVVGIIVEAVLGFSTEGMGALVSVTGQGVWSLMIAGALWGTAGLTGLAIDIGHDIRADRILLGRLADQAMVKASAAAPEPEPELVIEIRAPESAYAVTTRMGDEVVLECSRAHLEAIGIGPSSADATWGDMRLRLISLATGQTLSTATFSATEFKFWGAHVIYGGQKQSMSWGGAYAPEAFYTVLEFEYETAGKRKVATARWLCQLAALLPSTAVAERDGK